MNEQPINLPLASGAALFLGELGRVLVWSGVALFALALLQNIFRPARQRFGSICFLGGCVCLFGAFLTLGTLFVQNQFEYAYVYEHSEKSSALPYKIAAIWSGQQGSFLLWACTSSIFALLTFRRAGPYRRWYTAIFATFLGSLCGILAYESPFALQLVHGQAYVLPDGAGLVDSLRNYWVVIHPPTIFLGFGSLTVLFAYSLSALITGNFVDWARLVRPWSLVSLSLVGLGLCMGGLWAYDTLGWGGFWMWDPVENVSFVPWIFTAALIHGLIVQGTKGTWTFSNLFLGGMPFLLFVYGTFLTRSGFLGATSVHSFATMEQRALLMLIGFGSLATLTFIGLWLRRWLQSPKPSHAKRTKGTDREGWYRFGSIFLVLLGASTAIGMSVPFIQLVAHQPQKVVEEHLYHLVLPWFFVPIMLMMAVGPFVTWRKIGWRQLFTRVFNIFSVTIGLLGALMLLINNPEHGVRPVAGEKIAFPFGYQVLALPWILFLIGVCLFAGVANIWRICEIWKRSRPAAGAFISHLGVATALAGLIVSRGLERHQTFALQENELSSSLDGGGIPITMMLHDADENKMLSKDNKLDIDVIGDEGRYTINPSFYFVQTSDGPKQYATPSIHWQPSHDSYFAVKGRQIEAGDPQSLAPGETKPFKVLDWQAMREFTYSVTYQRFERKGEVASAGTQMLAHLSIALPNRTKVEVSPGLAIAGGGGPQMLPAIIDSGTFINMTGMNAADKSVSLQMGYIRPMYELDFFYKPMTILVWLGAGILFVGGLMSAWYRRKVLKAVEDLPISGGEPTVGPAQKPPLN